MCEPNITSPSSLQQPQKGKQQGRNANYMLRSGDFTLQQGLLVKNQKGLYFVL